MIPLVLFFFFISFIDVVSSTSLSCHQENGGFLSNLPYPFGLSESSGIQLNCSGGEIKIGDYVVKNITNDHVYVEFPENCDHDLSNLDKVRNLEGRNFAVSSRNILILKECEPPMGQCLIPGNLLENGLGLEGCGGVENVSCYIDERRSEFLDFGKVGKNCSRLVSSIVVEARKDDDSGESYEKVVALDFNRVELGWWLLGNNCSCDSKADCVIVNGTYFNGGGGGGGEAVKGYRCRCKSGFTGDGFADGGGCHRG